MHTNSHTFYYSSYILSFYLSTRFLTEFSSGIATGIVLTFGTPIFGIYQKKTLLKCSGPRAEETHKLQSSTIPTSPGYTMLPSKTFTAIPNNEFQAAPDRLSYVKMCHRPHECGSSSNFGQSPTTTHIYGPTGDRTCERDAQARPASVFPWPLSDRRRRLGQWTSCIWEWSERC